MVICLERGADLHMAQLMPLPLTVSCFRKIQIGFTFLVPAHPGSPGKRAVKRVCVCVCVCLSVCKRISGTSCPVFTKFLCACYLWPWLSPPLAALRYFISNKCIAVRKVTTQLRELTYHMGSHSVTCHPAEVTFPPLPQPKLILD